MGRWGDGEGDWWGRSFEGFVSWLMKRLLVYAKLW